MSTVNDDIPEQSDSAANIVWRRLMRMNASGVGNKGPQGDTGPQGIQGEEGIQGESGNDGLKGAKGDPGLSGKSAFEIAKIHGYPGNESEWMDSLVGPQGTKGDQGLIGPKGDTGSDGIQGPKGDTGSQGVKGDSGIQGIAGIKGNAGDQGIPGIKGDTGSQGIQGIKGDTGLQGVKGDTGAQGIKGDTGSSATVQYENGIAALPALILGGSTNIIVPLSGSFPNTTYTYKVRAMSGVSLLTMLTFTEVSRTVNSITVKAQSTGLASVAGLLLIDAYKN